MSKFDTHKYFKPFLTRCKDCGAAIAILRTVNGKTIAVKADLLSEQELSDIKRGINFFYNPTKHTYHLSTCPGFRDKQKRAFGVPVDDRYGEKQEGDD